MATATTPAKPRKQLADQLDRLDGIIDLLADGLPQAVADATRAGTRETFVELLADPEVIAKLKDALSPNMPEMDNSMAGRRLESAARCGSFARLKSVLRSAAKMLVCMAASGITAVKVWVMSTAVAVVTRVNVTLARHINKDIPVVKYAAVAIVAGAIAAVVAYTVPQVISAGLCGLGAAGTTAGCLVVARIRRSRRLEAASALRYAQPTRELAEMNSESQPTRRSIAVDRCI